MEKYDVFNKLKKNEKELLHDLNKVLEKFEIDVEEAKVQGIVVATNNKSGLCPNGLRAEFYYDRNDELQYRCV